MYEAVRLAGEEARQVAEVPLSFVALRVAAGLSQQDAAEFLNVRHDTIKHWSSARRPPPAGAVAQLLEVIRRQEVEASALAPLLAGAGDVDSHLATSDEEAQARGWPLAILHNVMVMRAWAMAAIPN
jgi:DNA-binding transcriptional regulator YiaG